MKIYSVFSEEFKAYGKVLEGAPVEGMLRALSNIDIPEKGCTYTVSVPALEECEDSEYFKNNLFGGMDIQIGMSKGRNNKLNCLEYHRSSEVLLADEDLVLPLALITDLKDWQISSSDIKCFLLPKGKVLELYATTLHCAACNPCKPFRVAVVQPKGTNLEKPQIKCRTEEDKILWARNNWFFVHKDSGAAGAGAHIGFVGEPVEITEM